MSNNPDEEYNFAIQREEESVRYLAGRLGLEDKFQRYHSILKHKYAWNKFLKWRQKEEAKMNTYARINNEETDAEIADMMRSGQLASQKGIEEYLALKYRASGIRSTILRLDLILSKFCDEILKEKADEK